MTFEQILERANATASHKYHVFGEYSDGKRGYFQSFDTLDKARKRARGINGGIVYDREGNDIYYGF